MKFISTKLKGVYIIKLDKIYDNRGYFARFFCKEKFKEHNLETQFNQNSLSYNNYSGTVRGIHYQKEPYGETKLVSCIRGKIQDIVIDLRSHSSTYQHTLSVELDEKNNFIYIPKNCAHGFQTLTDDTMVLYLISGSYSVKNARGIRWNDAHFSIKWKLNPTIISEKDKSYEDFKTKTINAFTPKRHRKI